MRGGGLQAAVRLNNDGIAGCERCLVVSAVTGVVWCVCEAWKMSGVERETDFLIWKNIVCVQVYGKVSVETKMDGHVIAISFVVFVRKIMSRPLAFSIFFIPFIFFIEKLFVEIVRAERET